MEVTRQAGDVGEWLLGKFGSGKARRAGPRLVCVLGDDGKPKKYAFARCERCGQWAVLVEGAIDVMALRWTDSEVMAYLDSLPLQLGKRWRKVKAVKPLFVAESDT